MSQETYDVAIIGGGVTGTALLYLLAKYSSVQRVVLLEQYDGIAQVSSHHTQNSQTLHFGDIETNYSLEKAKAVKSAAEMVVRYVESLPDGKGIFVRQQKMVIAVGKKECDELRKRFQEFRTVFPELQLVEREELARREPAVMEGRDPGEEIVALATDRGYSVSFSAIAESFVRDAILQKNIQIDVVHNARVQRIVRQGKDFVLQAEGLSFVARTAVVAAGAHSLSFAHDMGEGKDLSLIPVAGLFYTAQNRLRGKVYTVQHPKLPFAAIHGDPDVLDATMMRFGPIAKALPLLEIRKWRTVGNFLKVFPLSIDTLRSVIAINADAIIRRFIFRNFWYDLPWIGPVLFVREARKIIPKIQPADLHFGSSLGGIRPQVVNIRTHSMQLGEAKIVGDRILYNITPSPGASVCLANALSDARLVTGWLNVPLDEGAIERDLGLITVK
ncbi:MAG: FAD-dependent oxidoreductase [Patescibacteria group bacterium]